MKITKVNKQKRSRRTKETAYFTPHYRVKYYDQVVSVVPEEKIEPWTPTEGFDKSLLDLDESISNQAFVKWTNDQNTSTPKLVKKLVKKISESSTPVPSPTPKRGRPTTKIVRTNTSEKNKVTKKSVSPKNSDSSRSPSPVPTRRTTRGQATPVEKTFRKGDEVLAKWTDRKEYYAVILSVSQHNTYEVLFFDGNTSNNVKAHLIRKIPINFPGRPYIYIDSTHPAFIKLLNPKSKQNFDNGRILGEKSPQPPAISDDKEDTDEKSISNSPIPTKITSTEPTKVEPKIISRGRLAIGKPDEKDWKKHTEWVPDLPAVKSFDNQVQGVRVKFDFSIKKITKLKIIFKNYIRPFFFLFYSNSLSQNLKKPACIYPDCNKTFRNEHLLEKHVKIVHLKESSKDKVRSRTVSTVESERSVKSKKSSLPESDTDISVASKVSSGISFTKNTEKIGQLDADLELSSASEEPEVEKSSSESSIEEEEPEYEERFENVINCDCSEETIDDDSLVIQCENCLTWQHVFCVTGQMQKAEDLNDIFYVCRKCVSKKQKKNNITWLLSNFVKTGYSPDLHTELPLSNNGSFWLKQDSKYEPKICGWSDPLEPEDWNSKSNEQKIRDLAYTYSEKRKLEQDFKILSACQVDRENFLKDIDEHIPFRPIYCHFWNDLTTTEINNHLKRWVYEIAEKEEDLSDFPLVDLRGIFRKA